MSKHEDMSVFPPMNGQTGDISVLNQSVSEQTCKLDDTCKYNGPSEVNHLLVSGAVQIELQESSSAAITGVTNGKQQVFTGEVLNTSFNECLGAPAEDVSKNSQRNRISCPLQTKSEQKHESSGECLYPQQSEQMNHIIPNEHGEKSTKGCSSAGGDDKLGPISEDVCHTSRRGTEKTLGFGSGDECNQLCSGISQSEAEKVDDMACISGVEGNLQPCSEQLTEICPTVPLEPTPEGGTKCIETVENACRQDSAAHQTPGFTVTIRSGQSMEVTDNVGCELLPEKPVEASTLASCCVPSKKLGPSPNLVNKSSPTEHLKPPAEVSTTITRSGCSAPTSNYMAENCLAQSETNACVVKHIKHMGRKGKKASKLLNKKCSDRVLRSREKPKAPKPDNHLPDASSHGQRRKKNKNKRIGTKTSSDEYSGILKHLRYLLNRISYETSLIDAYSGEGWKGLSLEKLKPEKELQRATSEILRRKLKIRDLFRRLDSLCAEGTLPTSLFDSEGEIDSEDIFCAKCGSKDLSLDNDIILCDGACDRGFHQYCLDPPLLKEDIPPDDEGWLCPGCNCKVDCIDLINDLQGTNLIITDNWEKVFPEAAPGKNQDPNFGLPSDDSDDDDYNPDGSATEEKDQGDESSSDESDYVSASDGPKAPATEDVYLGLPSDDSEDDDFDPDAPKSVENSMQDSSSSDFTSDSEDLAAVLENDKSPGNKEDTRSSARSIRQSHGRKKIESDACLNNELLNSKGSAQDDGISVYEKRRIERLDYKKLYDETYGNLGSDSSDDDEEWTDSVPSKIEEALPVSANGSAAAVNNQKTRKNISRNLKKTEGPHRRKKACQNFATDDPKSPAKPNKDCSTPSSSQKKSSSSYKRLGEYQIQRLADAFKQNQYPDKTAKGRLSNELGLTIRQVGKWFENTRWSFNHPSSPSGTKSGNPALRNGTPQSNKQPNQQGPETITNTPIGKETKNVESSKARAAVKKYSTNDTNNEQSSVSSSKKRKRKEQSTTQTPDTKSKAKVTLTSGRVLRSRKKSGV